MRIPKSLLMLTHSQKRVVARVLFSGCLVLAAAAWPQTSTANLTPEVNNSPAGLRARASTDPTVQSATSAPSSVLPQFAFGGGWYSALYFTNLTGSPVSFPVSFVGDEGTPLTIPSLGGSTVEVNLAAFSSAVIEAPNAGNLHQGYAAFTLPIGVSGYGVFRQSLPGEQDQEAVVPLSVAGATSNTLTWDETNLITAVAVVNPSPTAETVALTLWDDNGTVIGTSSIALPPNSKTATTLRSLPGLSGMVGKRGSAQFSVSSGSVAVLGLRFNGLAFTSIPTTTSAAAANPRSSVLPQFAFGGGWYSALYFTNLTESPVSFPVSFVADAGTELTVPALGGSTTQVNLAAHGTAIIEAPNVGDLVQGYPKFTLPAGVFGYGVFRQSLPGQQDQEAVVPLSAAEATSNTLTWDETNLITAVAVVNPSSSATTVAVTLWDESGDNIGTSSIALPPNSKTATVLRSLPGLSGMVGKRGSAQFSVSAGSVAVLGLRFNGLAFTSIPTSVASDTLVTERALAQTGLAIGQASTVLQSQFSILQQLLDPTSSCTPLPGGGSVQTTSTATIYYDADCSRPYIATGSNTSVTMSNSQIVISETANYYLPNGASLGTMTLNETAQASGGFGFNVHGLGVFTPAGGARTPVQLGVYCTFGSSGSARCAGAIAQDFPSLGIAIGAVTPLRISFGRTVGAPVNFTGGGTAVTGPLGSLLLTNPSSTSLVIDGGAAYATTTASGSAGAFVLFPPTPTAWTLTDSAHDQQFQISLVDNISRTLTLSITQITTGITLATGTLDQSGSGTIAYSDGSIAAVTLWTLAD
jgi:P pilus assembly chaperone PapD